MAKNFHTGLSELSDYSNIERALLSGNAPVSVSGCVDSELVQLAAELPESGRRVLLLTYNEVRARELWEDAQTLVGRESLLYPARDLLFSQADVTGNLLSRQRMRGIRALLEQSDSFIISTVDALLCRLASPGRMLHSLLRLAPGEEKDPGELAKRLVQMGFSRESIVQQPGDFALRGGILDIYPLTEDNPVRIEFFDNEIDSVRSFDAESQRSRENLEEVLIFPTDETGDASSCLLDYLTASDFVVLDEPERMQEKAEAVAKEYQESAVKRMEAGEKDSLLSLYDPDSLWPMLERPRCLILSGLPYRGRPVRCEKSFNVEARTIHAYNGQFELLLADLKKMQREKYRTVLLCGSRSRAERLAGQLMDYDLPVFFAAEAEKSVEPGQILVTAGGIHKSYEFPSLRLAVI